MLSEDRVSGVLLALVSKVQPAAENSCRPVIPPHWLLLIGW